MNIDLTTDVDFWDFGAAITVSLYIAALAFVVGAVFSVYALWASSKSANYTAKVKTGVETDKDKTADIKTNPVFVEFAVKALTISFVICIALAVSALWVNSLEISMKEERQTALKIQEAINDTYEVEITLAEARTLINGYTEDRGYRTSTVDESVLDTSSDEYVSTESYGITPVLQNDEQVVEVQLVRVKQEFRLVYNGESTEEYLDLPEVDKRQR